MAINTSTLLELEKRLMQAAGDFLEFATTDNITTNKSVISTTLQSFDDGDDGYFNDFWIHIQGTNNPDVERKLGSTTYATATGTAYVYGANLAAESGAITCRITRYKREKYKTALLRAIEEVYAKGLLYKGVDNLTLVTGNRAVDGHFESWSSSTALTYWTATNITLAQTSTAGLTRGGTYSAKCTADAANGYISIHSNTYPELLDFQCRTIDAFVQALPQTADDANIVIYTKQADGTEQTLTSTTATPAGEFTEIKNENLSINDNLTDFEIRLKVTTNGQYVYYDDLYVGDRNLTKYLLPDDFVSGELKQVWIQRTGESDEMFYDLNSFTRERGEQIPFVITSNGTNRYLELMSAPINERRLRLLGEAPLETLSALTDTITLDEYRIPLLIAKARMIFWEREAVPVSSEDKSKFVFEYGQARRDYTGFLGLKMTEKISLQENVFPPYNDRYRYWGGYR